MASAFLDKLNFIIRGLEGSGIRATGRTHSVGVGGSDVVGGGDFSSAGGCFECELCSVSDSDVGYSSSFFNDRAEGDESKVIFCFVGVPSFTINKADVGLWRTGGGGIPSSEIGEDVATEEFAGASFSVEDGFRGKPSFSNWKKSSSSSESSEALDSFEDVERPSSGECCRESTFGTLFGKFMMRLPTRGGQREPTRMYAKDGWQRVTRMI